MRTCSCSRILETAGRIALKFGSRPGTHQLSNSQRDSLAGRFTKVNGGVHVPTPFSYLGNGWMNYDENWCVVTGLLNKYTAVFKIQRFVICVTAISGQWCAGAILQSPNSGASVVDVISCQ